MIALEFDAAERAGRIVIQPNHSWSWRANVWLVAVLAAVSGAIGLGFAWRGMWPVLPFAGLEVVVVLGSLYYCVRRTHTQEVLTFSPDMLLFERGVREPRVRRQFQRYFTRIFVRPPPHPWYRKRIALRCRGQELEIGSFLTSEEKDDLVSALRDMIQRIESLPPDSLSRQ